MKIYGIQKLSTIDYPKKFACVVFLSGCNFKCGYCHNPELNEFEEGKFSEENFFRFLDSRKRWIDGVVISGGEPTLQIGLPEFIEKIKQGNYSVKLDTNGSNPQILNSLLEKKLVDYIAMDVKASKEKYNEIINSQINLKRVEKSMKIVQRFQNYEFRTTVINGVHELEEIEDIARWIVGVTKNKKHKYYLQAFVPKKGNLLDSRFEKINETSNEYLEECLIEARKFLVNAEIR